MLFNLFLVDMINKVHDMKLGIQLGSDVITIISYADDIIAFARCIGVPNDPSILLIEPACVQEVSTEEVDSRDEEVGRSKRLPVSA